VLEDREGARRLGHVAQALCQHERVFERERCTLPDMRPNRMRRIAHQANGTAMPRGQREDVVYRPHADRTRQSLQDRCDLRRVAVVHLEESLSIRVARRVDESVASRLLLLRDVAEPVGFAAWPDGVPEESATNSNRTPASSAVSLTARLTAPRITVIPPTGTSASVRPVSL